MKTRIITQFYKNVNYGGVLQAYALRSIVDEITKGGCEQILYGQPVIHSSFGRRIVKAITHPRLVCTRIKGIVIPRINKKHNDLVAASMISIKDLAPKPFM